MVLFLFQSPFNDLQFSILADSKAKELFDINSNGVVITRPGVNLATEPYIDYNVSDVFFLKLSQVFFFLW